MNNTCKSGKISYHTKQDAIKTMGLHTKHKAKVLGAYRCSICDEWHLGRRVLNKIKR